MQAVYVLHRQGQSVFAVQRIVRIPHWILDLDYISSFETTLLDTALLHYQNRTAEFGFVTQLDD